MPDGGTLTTVSELAWHAPTSMGFKVVSFRDVWFSRVVMAEEMTKGLKLAKR